ncbi:phytanoyl-CoA dioxygenase family protein [Methylotenera sp.]|uniref:phytanoyl-CoA dioxygenase family protein n=1 Tax=Methylotenera sp. TaxID=2051956 RepID=UPI00248757CC|nr:phytanoyl-CoA dioxygenase family protein [Methylotenera sp.]MDI1298156.1 phytanoyl-CoA dioxygenase family protein [Methylotenera sp.]
MLEGNNLKFDEIGFEVLENILTEDEVRTLLEVLKAQKLKPLGGGIRRIEQLIPEVAALSKSEKLISIARSYLVGEPQFVRAIFFDKTPENNWFVTWHQDRTVTVSERFEQSGWGPWSLKAGAWHVQPPLAVLESMITIRLNLDPSTISNGCLKFIPGSHKNGVIKSAQVQEHIKNGEPTYCEALSGSAIVMRPHIFHASEKAITKTRRRVLHFEYSSYQLPHEVSWSA